MRTIALIFQLFLSSTIAGLAFSAFIYNARFNDSLPDGVAFAGALLLMVVVMLVYYSAKELYKHLKDR